MYFKNHEIPKMYTCIVSKEKISNQLKDQELGFLQKKCILRKDKRGKTHSHEFRPSDRSSRLPRRPSRLPPPPRPPWPAAAALAAAWPALAAPGRALGAPGRAWPCPGRRPP